MIKQILSRPAFVIISLIFLYAGSGLAGPLQAGEAADKITVLSPLGKPPAIHILAMAPRLQSLDGKTIYVVDTRYPLTESFVQQLHKMLAEKYPKTNWVFRNKIGSYFDDDPKLWAEIKEKGHGMIMAIGH